MNTPFETPTEEAPDHPPIAFGDTQEPVEFDSGLVEDEEVAEEPAATEAEEPVEEPAATENVGSKIAKRTPSDLEGDVLAVAQSFVNGTVKLPEGKQLTPHAISKLVEANRGDDNPVSAGAVSDALKRWEQLGFATLSEKPVAFAAFAGASTKEHLNDLKEERREQLAAERAAAREAKKAAQEAETAPVEPATEEPAVEVEASDPVNDEPQAEGTTEPSGF